MREWLKVTGLQGWTSKASADENDLGQVTFLHLSTGTSEASRLGSYSNPTTLTEVQRNNQKWIRRVHEMRFGWKSD